MATGSMPSVCATGCCLAYGDRHGQGKRTMAGDGELAGRAAYQIRVQGKLDRDWADWFDGMSVATESQPDGSAVTTFTGDTLDQSALRGALDKIWNLNLTLLSVVRIERISQQEGVELDG